jgi:hypothetical protein
MVTMADDLLNTSDKHFASDEQEVADEQEEALLEAQFSAEELAEAQEALDPAELRAQLQALKVRADVDRRTCAPILGPAERWCLWCEQIFVPEKRKQNFCLNYECQITRETKRLAYRRAYGGCPDCGFSFGQHTPHCKGVALEALGLPEGPCPYCQNGPGHHRDNCWIYYFVAQDGLCAVCGRELDPQVPYPNLDYITRDHLYPRSRVERDLKVKQLPHNTELVHKRCNEWKGNNPAPFGQPAWGILLGVPRIRGYWPSGYRANSPVEEEA